MDYFYTPIESISTQTLQLDREEFHHCCNVLRKEIGETIFTLDGRGTRYEVVLKKKGKDFIEGDIISRIEHFHEPVVSLTLAVGLLKNPAKFDFIIEKTTELGVKKIIPMISHHTIAKNIKMERLNNLALSAMKQCGRGYLPEISPTATFKEVIFTSEPYDAKLIAFECARENSSRIPENAKSSLIVIGSEGGFSAEEIEHAQENKFNLLSLGERRLRTETAAITVCALFTSPTAK